LNLNDEVTVEWTNDFYLLWTDTPYVGDQTKVSVTNNTPTDLGSSGQSVWTFGKDSKGWQTAASPPPVKGAAVVTTLVADDPTPTGTVGMGLMTTVNGKATIKTLGAKGTYYGNKVVFTPKENVYAYLSGFEEGFALKKESYSEKTLFEAVEAGTVKLEFISGNKFIVVK